jgi:hypothetical protein
MKLCKSTKWLLGLLLLLMPFVAAPLLASNEVSPVLPAYGDVQNALGSSPLKVCSWEKEGLLVAQVQGLLDYPFARIKDALSHPESWCEFIPLVLNIKSCIFWHRDGQDLLTIYIGRKFFESPQEARRLDYVFRVLQEEQDHFRVSLCTSEGPWGTSDYSIELQALAAGEGRTYIRMHSSYRPSLRCTIATKVYLATAGHSKVGFSVEKYDENEPVYTRGVKGVIERNAMRYYLALKAFLDTLHLPEEKRFDARLNAWYAFTDKFHKQLYEMDKEEYLDAKRRERNCQLQLQQGWDRKLSSKETVFINNNRRSAPSDSHEQSFSSYQRVLRPGSHHPPE